MTMLQKQAVQMIQDMSDDNVGFLMRREQTLEEILDGKLYDFNPDDIDNEEFIGIDRRSTVNPTRLIREGVMPPLLTMNLNITKEIRDFLKVSFFANNMFRSTPLWESKKNPGSYTRRNTTENVFFFGLELTAIIR